MGSKDDLQGESDFFDRVHVLNCFFCKDAEILWDEVIKKINDYNNNESYSKVLKEYKQIELRAIEEISDNRGTLYNSQVADASGSYYKR